jgi:hypothetical protein
VQIKLRLKHREWIQRSLFGLDSFLKQSGTVDAAFCPTIMTIRNAVHNDCSASLAKIESMPTSALRTLWRELIGGSAPAILRRELLVPILAYKLQEKTYGGLKPSTRTHLRRLATSLAVDKSAPLTRESRFKPGTRLIREWRGETHEVTIRSSGFLPVARQEKRENGRTDRPTQLALNTWGGSSSAGSIRPLRLCL